MISKYRQTKKTTKQRKSLSQEQILGYLRICFTVYVIDSVPGAE